MKKTVFIFCMAFCAVIATSAQSTAVVDSLLKGYELYGKGLYAESEAVFLRIVKQTKTEDKTVHSGYTDALLYLSTYLLKKGEFKASEQYALEANSIVERDLGKEHPDYIYSLTLTGTIYRTAGNYKKAGDCLLSAFDLAQQFMEETHLYYPEILTHLGLYYLETGQYEKVETIMLQALAVCKKVYGEQDIRVSNILEILGLGYAEMGNYDEAEKRAQEALEMVKLLQGESSSEYAEKSAILTRIYMQKGDRKKALSTAEISTAYFKKHLGENHPTYLQSLSGIILLMEDDPACNFADIENLYLELVGKKQKVMGEKHLSYIITLSNWLNFYNNHGKEKEFQNLLPQALKTVESSLTYNHAIHQAILLVAGMHYFKAGNFAEAQSYFTKHFQISKNQMQENFPLLSEKERELFLLSKENKFNVFRSFSYQYYTHEKNEIVGEFAYNCELFSKSLLLNASQNVRLSIFNSPDSDLIPLWETLNSAKENYIALQDEIKQAELLLDDDRLTLLKKEASDFNSRLQQEEKEIMKKSNGFQKNTKDFSLQWTDIQKKLSKNEAAIEFIRADTVYCALLVRPEYEYPQMIALCEEKDLQAALQQSPCDGKAIYPLVWQPLEKYMEGVNELFIAPSGLLHGVAFEGLKKENHYLGESHIIHNLLSTKDIAAVKEKTNEQEKLRQAVLFGGADFGLPVREPAQNATRGQGFDYLPGSKKEVQIIEKQLTGFHWKTSLFVDKDATETQFKSFSSTQSPEILHISTHGFYFPQAKIEEEQWDENPSQQNTYRLSNNPLMRTGLAFTGANHVWSGKEPTENLDDGILTAYEVSNLNLSNTELVVLSACDTGLGDIVGSEGVFGLQRAFRLAGVQNLLVSLWKVPDKETIELMSEFYSQWTNGNTVKKALRNAQNKLCKTYPDQPEKWAGFILIE